MGTRIYYFSGTGNCLSTAREIAKALGGCDVIPMVKFRGVQEVAEDSDAVGLVFPEHFLGVPSIVEDFVGRLRVKEDAYVFAVVSYGAVEGTVLADLERSLQKRGVRLSAGFSLKQPDNYIIFLTMPPEEKQAAIFREAKARLARIIEAIKNKEQAAVKSHNRLLSVAYGPFSRSLSANFYRASKKFWTTEGCNGCGICGRLCPLGNIEVIDKKVSWGEDCVQCLACVHWCPRGAIEIAGRTRNKKRYHHPEITIKDMVRQAEDK